MFNGELPNIPLRWSRSTKLGGAVTYTWDTRTGELIPDSMEMQLSKMYKRELEDFKLVAIHEMIHVWVATSSGYSIGILKRINQPAGHGQIFLKKLKELNNKFNIDIPLTDKFDGGVSDSVKIPKAGFVLLNFKGKDRLAGFTQNYFLKNQVEITVAVLSHFVGVRPKMMFTTQAPESFKFRKARSIKGLTMSQFSDEELKSMLAHKSTKIVTTEKQFKDLNEGVDDIKEKGI